MKMTVIGSGSSGNCYILEGRRSALILECGVPPVMVMQRTTLDFTKVAGCLVTHEHADHAGSARKFADLGLTIYASTGTLDAIGHPSPSRALPAMSYTGVGEFQVLPFHTRHDAVEPVGYVIRHPELGRLLFVTDTAPIPYSFKDLQLDHIMVEANYDDAILDGNVDEGRIPAVLAGRTRRAHLSIRAAVELVRANETGRLKTVTLMHLSERNSSGHDFERQMREAVVFADVYVARPGLTVKMSNRYEL